VPRKRINGTEDFGSKFRPAVGERPHQTEPGFTIFAEGSFGIVKVALQSDRGAIVEGVSKRRRRVDPF
jgi:hypothetical protein